MVRWIEIERCECLGACEVTALIVPILPTRNASPITHPARILYEIDCAADKRKGSCRVTAKEPGKQLSRQARSACGCPAWTGCAVAIPGHAELRGYAVLR